MNSGSGVSRSSPSESHRPRTSKTLGPCKSNAQRLGHEKPVSDEAELSVDTHLAARTANLITRTIDTANAGQIAPRFIATAGTEEQWFALHTRSRHEKVVADHFRARGIQHLLPLCTTSRKWQDRKKVVSTPIFPGYVFVRLLLSNRLQVLTTPGAVRLLGSGPHPVPLNDSEVQWLENCVKQSVCLEPHPYLKIGSRVRVRSGPLADLEGILIRKKNQFRLVLSVDLIQSSVSAEVDMADVAPAA
jgi:transcription antitermination factor NusG